MRFMLPFLVSAAIAWPIDVPAQETPTPTGIQERVIHAIVPTTAGQIGINPPPEYPVETGGDYNSFLTNYVDSSGKWTASNTDMITQVQVTTKGDKPITTTVTAPVAVMTGPSDTLDILLAPSLNQELDAMIKNVPLCTKKRSACGVLHLLEVFKDNNSAAIQKFKAVVQDIKFLTREAIEDLFKSMNTGVTEAQFITALGEGAGAAPIMFAAWFLYHEASSIPSRFKYKNPPKNTLPTIEAPPKLEEPEKCAKPDAKGKDAPACPDCDGKDNTCQKGEYKHCQCLSVGKPSVYALSQKWLDAQTNAIKDAIAQVNDKPDVTCPKGGYDTAISVDQSFVNKLADKFCSDRFDATKEHSSTLANADISSDAYKKYTFDFWYSPGNEKDKKCTASCIDSIKGITSKCMGLSSHDVAPNGNATTSCGARYGYKITVPNKPKDADIKCSSKDYSQAVPVDNKFFNSMSEKFCKGLSEDVKIDLKNSDIGSTAYSGYSFHFESTLNRDCQPDCASTLKNMASKCQGQNSHSIQASGTASFSCGARYSYRISKEVEDNPKTPSDKIGEVHCFGKNEFKHGPVDLDEQGKLITWIYARCLQEPNGKFNPWMDETSAPRGYQVKMGDTDYSYTIEWIKGCKGPHENPLNPLNIREDIGKLTAMGELLGIDQGSTTVDGGKGLTCPDNGRAGGWRNAGCLRYTFKPQWNDKLAKVYWGKTDNPGFDY